MRIFLKVAGVAATILALMATVGLAAFSFGGERVVGGVVAGEVNLSGLTREECLEALQPLEERLAAMPVTFTWQDRTWTLRAAEIGLHLDAEATAARALEVGREGSWWQRLATRWRARRGGLDLPLVYAVNREKFTRQVSDLAASIASPPQDAAFRVLPGDVIEIIPGREGLEVDTERAYQDLLLALAAGNAEPVIGLNLTRVKPRVTTEEVQAMGLKGLLASYTTRFDPSDIDRAYNIRVAAAALDGLLVPPGQEVSFNNVVGPRSHEAGYKNARVIVNNQFVEGPGGGVCQVSTTLYNAVLLANLEILERTNHSLPVSYVPLGRDATVVYGYIDLRFRNNTESYLYIRSYVEGDRLTFKIYGNTDYRVPVEIRTQVVEVLEPKIVQQVDPNLTRGEQVVKQKGSRGYRVTAQRVVREGDRVYMENLPDSFYEPVDQVVVIGAKEPSTGPVVPPPAGQEKERDAREPAAGPVAPGRRGQEEPSGSSPGAPARASPSGQAPLSGGESPPGQASPEGWQERQPQP
ncbi:VanW family protein [Desulfovirgula thermocuniculi]|uniref:VanW family protein n=1 Tax=Desulfovirgula thermocuniculi TaxID=348842 RepID=UPI000426AC55|nr:VanW family protein [Desulfovirgula thermocuniculi]